MDVSLRRGKYAARFAETAADIHAAQSLRHLCFVERAGGAARPDRRDRDHFDDLCRHVLIEEVQGGRLVCVFRLMQL